MLRQWCGFSLLGSPMMTHTLGPVIRLPEGKAVSQASQRRKLIETGLAQMPRASGFLQALEPGKPHAMDYNLAGFEIGVRYTYRLDARTSIDNLWSGLKDKARNSVRRAKLNLTISGGMPLMEFYALYERNLGRAGRFNHHDGAVYHRLNEALSKRTRHHIIAATNKATGKTVAATIVVWDAYTLYYLRATQDGTPEARGAASLLLWEAILLAHRLGLMFDSDSYFRPSGAKFIEAFGCIPVERLTIRRRSSALKAAMALRNRMPLPGGPVA